MFAVNTSFSFLFLFMFFFEKNAPVIKHKDVRTRLGSGTISYKSLYFVHPTLVSRGRWPNWIEVRLCTFFKKKIIWFFITRHRNVYILLEKKKQNKKQKTRNTDLCNYMMTYKTTDETDHYVEYLRFSLRLKLLSYLHSFVLSIKRKRGKGGCFNFSGRVCVTKRLARG